VVGIFIPRTALGQLLACGISCERHVMGEAGDRQQEERARGIGNQSAKQDTTIEDPETGCRQTFKDHARK